MLALIGLAVSLSEATQPADDLHKVPIEYQEVGRGEIRVPISDSVRAATWDQLPVKPSQPTRIRLACIVWVRFGAPDSCIPASLVKPGLQTLDWIEARAANDLSDRSSSPTDIRLRNIANLRIDTGRLTPRRNSNAMFVIRFFDEVISPTDARPPFVSGNALNLRDVTLKKAIDANLLQDLYPVSAIRYSLKVRANITCRIEPNLKLLCHDPGAIQVEPNNTHTTSFDVIQSLRFATYQVASTMEFEKKGKDGTDIASQDLRINIGWQLP